MTTIVLIPGAWHGNWCWSEVTPLLRAARYRVVTPELVTAPQAPLYRHAQALPRWVDQIARLIEVQPDPVVLVGHSRAGLVLSEVAERLPERVKLLIYVAAFLLRNGETLQDIASRAPNAQSFAAAIKHEDGFLTFDPGHAGRLLYNRTPDEIARAARGRLIGEPATTFVTPVSITEERFEGVPRAYIECIQDMAIPLETQREMQAALPCEIVETLDSDHSPFLSMPVELVSALERCMSADDL